MRNGGEPTAANLPVMGTLPKSHLADDMDSSETVFYVSTRSEERYGLLTGRVILRFDKQPRSGQGTGASMA